MSQKSLNLQTKSPVHLGGQRGLESATPQTNGNQPMGTVTPINAVSKIAIANTELPIIEYQGQRVVTLAMIDQVHQRPEGTARRTFSDNRNRLIEGEDFYLIDYSQKDVLRTFGIEVPPRGLTVFAESGYLMLVKTFSDDLAWQVQRQLVKGYFKAKTTQAAPIPPRPKAPSISSAFKSCMAMAKLIGLEGNQAILSADRATRKLVGESPLELLEATLTAPVQQVTLTPTQIGKELDPSVSAQKVNELLEVLLGFQIKVSGVWVATEKGAPHCEVIDTSKRHNDGSTIKQIKWYASVLELIQAKGEAA